MITLEEDDGIMEIKFPYKNGLCEIHFAPLKKKVF